MPEELLKFVLPANEEIGPENMEQQRQNCVYTPLENRIHRLTMVTANRRGMEELLAHLGDILERHPQGETLRLLVDFRPDGIPSLPHGFPMLQQFFVEQPHVPHIRAAYLHNRNVTVSLLVTFLDRLELNSERRFFEERSGTTIEQDAIHWLLREE